MGDKGILLDPEGDAEREERGARFTMRRASEAIARISRDSAELYRDCLMHLRWIAGIAAGGLMLLLGSAGLTAKPYPAFVYAWAEFCLALSILFSCFGSAIGVHLMRSELRRGADVAESVRDLTDAPTDESYQAAKKWVDRARAVERESAMGYAFLALYCLSLGGVVFAMAPIIIWSGDLAFRSWGKN